ncbi:MAG: sugar ABC transporter permease [Proteobacteria bacterium]|nr:sugar ABC transporter permease [Pseudomonadota bacterium]
MAGADVAISTAGAQAARERRLRPYLLFIWPALIVCSAVIIFPWLFTVWMSLHDFHIGSPMTFIGLENYKQLAGNRRFLESIGHTFYFTVLSVALPMVLGTLAALVFHKKFRGRGFYRTLFIMPMMATPVAVSLIWTMMFHPQLGVLNYLLSLVGLPPSQWVYAPGTVIPSLALVEVWLWTPFCMIIVLGGLASLPSEPYEAALIDGANQWQMFWNITFPLVAPFLVVALIIRTIDALKAFETIWVICNGGPGTSSETLNVYLYNQAFAYNQVGTASAVVVVFFAIIVALSLVLLWARQKAAWN